MRGRANDNRVICPVDKWLCPEFLLFIGQKSREGQPARLSPLDVINRVQHPSQDVRFEANSLSNSRYRSPSPQSHQHARKSLYIYQCPRHELTRNLFPPDSNLRPQGRQNDPFTTRLARSVVCENSFIYQTNMTISKFNRYIYGFLLCTEKQTEQISLSSILNCS